MLKKILFLYALSTTAAMAAPFVVSDPTTQTVTGCGIQIDTAAKVDLPLVASACNVDVGNVSTGPHTVKATFYYLDPVWGRSESVFSIPLSFVRPAAVMPTAPVNLTIMPK